MNIRPKPLVWLACLAALLTAAETTRASNYTGNATGAGLLGVMPQTISANAFAGAATSSYSFVVPPGRSGLQPNLSIMYGSGGGQGIMGRGWALGLPHIQRSTRRGQPSFTFADTFAINWAGRLLDLREVSDPGTGVREYRTEIETFLRIKSHTHSPALTYWEARTAAARSTSSAATGERVTGSRSGTFTGR